jgi:(p)ppGpp synthase/HD superfamily hydrolase
MKALNEAIIYATQAHGDQTDKQGQPYILHPLRVMLALAKQHAPIEAQMAAVLHDTVEDTDATLEEITARFGPVVAEIVDAVSRRDGEVYIEFIHRAAENPLARGVKRADISDNLSRPIPPDMVGIERRYRRALAVLDAAEAS